MLQLGIHATRIVESEISSAGRSNRGRSLGSLNGDAGQNHVENKHEYKMAENKPPVRYGERTPGVLKQDFHAILKMLPAAGQSCVAFDCAAATLIRTARSAGGTALGILESSTPSLRYRCNSSRQSAQLSRCARTSLRSSGCVVEATTASSR
jgi:hypothetical protein